MKRSCDEDCRLLDGIQRGDEAAVMSLYDRYSSAVYSIALRLLRDPARAEQVLSDIFLEIWLRPEKFMQMTKSLPLSLAMIARNRSVRMRLSKPASDLDFVPPDWIAEQQEWNMSPEEASGAIERLPTERRTMLERAFFGGMAQTEIDSQRSSFLKTEEPSGKKSEVSNLDGTGVEWIDPQTDLVSAKFRSDTKSGMELRDLLQDAEFPRRARKARNPKRESAALLRLGPVFAESPETVLQVLVDIAVEFCGADSAGISLEESDSEGGQRFRWVAIAGSFAQYVHGTTPRFFSPCGTCLSSGRAQLYRVTKPYYDFLGVTAEPITDGMLIPWVSEKMRGTIWAVAHRSRETFDLKDYELLNSLADFVSLAVRHQVQEQALRRLGEDQARATVTNELAHQINSPLQSLTNTMYLVQMGGANAQEYVKMASQELSGLCEFVRELLSVTAAPHLPLIEIPTTRTLPQSKS